MSSTATVTSTTASTITTPFSGITTPSKILDSFVIVHSAVATLFASAMLVYPEFFKLFVKDSENHFNQITSDSIRWASPFVFGFGGLAGMSLYFPCFVRKKIALMFILSFTLAVGIGTYTQTTGRWNEYHPANIVLFGFLAITYSTFLICLPNSFSRRITSNETKIQLTRENMIRDSV